MTNLKFKKSIQGVLIFLLLVVIGSSCEKEEVVIPDYIGEWMAIESITTEMGTFQVKDILTLTENDFEDLMKIPGATADLWIDFINVKGSVSVIENSMSVTISELGISTIDLATQLPTGVIVNFAEGSSFFDMLMIQSGLTKTNTSEFSISGNEMTLKTDLNKDGDFLDEGETIIYTRQV